MPEKRLKRTRESYCTCYIDADLGHKISCFCPIHKTKELTKKADTGNVDNSQKEDKNGASK